MDSVWATLKYTAASSRLNRRYVAGSVDLITTEYEERIVQIFSGRPTGNRCSLDNGFTLLSHKSAVPDFRSKQDVEAIYHTEVGHLIQQVTGADLVVTFGEAIRTVEGPPSRDVLERPAPEVHVDFTAASALRQASLALHRVEEKQSFRRFMVVNAWRAFSAPPQDWPLAVCDATTVADGEGMLNALVEVAALPDLREIPAELPEQFQGSEWHTFSYQAGHRWFYYPHMTRDELLLFTVYDSAEQGAWRTPHAAFRDMTHPDAVPRESIEVRSFAYYL